MPNSSDFRFLMIGAMYENGGNTTHRFLDGHPEMFVYPFESQPGTRYVDDMLSSTFPLKYRWPVFPLDATPHQDYKAIIDEEGKVRTRTPHVSKFRHVPFEMSDDERCRIYLEYIERSGRSTGNNVAAFFRATFDAWKDYRRSGRETVYVGYSPIITVDAHKILRPAAGTRPARRPQSMVGVRRHVETPRSAQPRELSPGLGAEPVLRAVVSRAVSRSGAHRARGRRHARSKGHAGRRLRKARSRGERFAVEGDVERRRAERGVSVGDDPHADTRSQPGHGAGAERGAG